MCIFKSRGRKQRHCLKKKGFTIAEIVLVIALIGLLSTFVIVKVGGIFEDTQDKTARFHVSQTFKTPLLKYRMDMGSYPSTEEGLESLVRPPSARQQLWKGPYVDSIPLDPWKTPYQYKYPGEKNPTGYDIRSAGPDRQMNTADDIGNWQVDEG